MLKDRYVATQKEFEQEKRKNHSLQEQINDKQRQLQKLQNHYDKLKRKVLLDPPQQQQQVAGATPRAKALATPDYRSNSRDYAIDAQRNNNRENYFNGRESLGSRLKPSQPNVIGKIVDSLSDTSFFVSQQPKRPSPLFFRWNK